MKREKQQHKSSPGFKVPEGYFETFEDQLMQNINQDSSVQSQKRSGFKVPEDYFESVEDTILNQCSANTTKVVNLKSTRTLFYISGMAASLILMVAIFFNPSTTNDPISTDVVETYLFESDLDSYELAELLSDANLLEEDFTITVTPYSENNLESYLLDNVNIESYLE